MMMMMMIVTEEEDDDERSWEGGPCGCHSPAPPISRYRDIESDPATALQYREFEIARYRVPAPGIDISRYRVPTPDNEISR
eukprot:4140533-Pyramimonas_sp.AAC.1